MTASRQPTGRRSVLVRIFKRFASQSQSAGLIGVIVALGVFFEVINPTFLASGNVIEIVLSMVLYFVVAGASTLVFIGGGLDFSVGATYAVGGVAACGLMARGVPWPLGLIAGVLVGGLIGVINATVTTYLRVPPLIATLGIFFVATGVVTVATGGNDIFTGIPSSFDALGSGKFLGIPDLAYVALVLGVAFYILLEKTTFGYEVKATGGNRQAASANGVHVKRIDLVLYTMCGATAALAGILFAARTAAASPQAGGYGLTFEVVTAVIIGGTSLFGGTGTVFGSALGCLLFAETDNGLAIINVNPLYQDVFIGIVLIAAVAIDQMRRGRQFRAGR